MYTSHGWYIKGTPVDDEETIPPPQCMGIHTCASCTIEAQEVAEGYAKEQKRKGMQGARPMGYIVDEVKNFPNQLGDRKLRIVPDIHESLTIPAVMFFGGGREVIGKAVVTDGVITITPNERWKHLFEIPNEGDYSLSVMGVIADLGGHDQAVLDGREPTEKVVCKTCGRRGFLMGILKYCNGCGHPTYNCNCKPLEAK